MHWLHTDAIYHLDCTSFSMPDDMRGAFQAWNERLTPAGFRFQWSTYAYAIASMLATLMGASAVYSTLRVPISVETGFVITGVTLIATAAELVWSRWTVNRLLLECRAMSEVADRRLREAATGAAPSLGSRTG